jgi:metal-sulfur cluster biosynthetic enzyme
VIGPFDRGSDALPAVSEPAVMQALDTVLDPELGMSIVDLGLVYDVRIRDAVVDVTMTLTAPGCPIHDVMPEWVRTVVMRVPGVESVDVTLTFEPPWTPDRIRPSRDPALTDRGTHGSMAVVDPVGHREQG